MESLNYSPHLRLGGRKCRLSREKMRVDLERSGWVVRRRFNMTKCWKGYCLWWWVVPPFCSQTFPCHVILGLSETWGLHKNISVKQETYQGLNQKYRETSAHGNTLETLKTGSKTKEAGNQVQVIVNTRFLRPTRLSSHENTVKYTAGSISVCYRFGFGGPAWVGLEVQQGRGSAHRK